MTQPRMMSQDDRVLWRLRHNTARPNILAAYQPQPVDPLLVGQAEGAF